MLSGLGFGVGIGGGGKVGGGGGGKVGGGGGGKVGGGGGGKVGGGGGGLVRFGGLVRVAVSKVINSAFLNLEYLFNLHSFARAFSSGTFLFSILYIYKRVKREKKEKKREKKNVTYKNGEP